MNFEVKETNQFTAELEEAAYWLYLHNLEQSQEFADRNFEKLENEINSLKNHLRKNPLMGQADEFSGVRRFPVHSGRYIVTWILNESEKVVTLLEFLDSKYPKELREFKFED